MKVFKIQIYLSYDLKLWECVYCGRDRWGKNVLFNLQII